MIDINKKIENIIYKIEDLSLDKSIKMDKKYNNLVFLTKELISLKKENGELKTDPTKNILKIKSKLSKDVKNYINGEVVLITGAAGTVGTGLVFKILKFKPKKLILIDKNKEGLDILLNKIKKYKIETSTEAVDIYNIKELEEIFLKNKPDVVFHLAAERLPSKVEKNINQTIRANLYGTKNIVELSVKNNVKRFICVSTGKCRNLFDGRLYTITKKLTELITVLYSKKNKTFFSIVRLHHIMENTFSKQIFTEQINKNIPITPHIHSEELRQTYNVDIATSLILNAGTHNVFGDIFSTSSKAIYFSVLNIALYLLDKSKKNLPILFIDKKTEDGYINEIGGTENVLLSENIKHSFNTIETSNLENFLEEEIISAKTLDFEEEYINKKINNIIKKLEHIEEKNVKTFLSNEYYDIALHLLKKANKELVINSFIWAFDLFANKEVLNQNTKNITLLLETIKDYKTSDFKNINIIDYKDSLIVCKEVFKKDKNIINLTNKIISSCI